MVSQYLEVVGDAEKALAEQAFISFRRRDSCRARRVRRICSAALRRLFSSAVQRKTIQNNARLCGGNNETPFVKDAFHRYLISSEQDAVNPAQTGTNSAADYSLTIGAGATATILLRLSPSDIDAESPITVDEIDQVFETRKAEADDFYASVTPQAMPADRVDVMRQALAGMLWSKQHYFYDLGFWLREHSPNSGGSGPTRNNAWLHMVNDDVISMPDKWEYPWFAAWDLAFHCISLSMVDSEFAKPSIRANAHALSPESKWGRFLPMSGISGT